MKKITLSLAALFAVSIASAQSYPKQPDKTVVEYRNYYKPAAAPKSEATEAEVKEAKPQSEPAAKEQSKIQKTTTPAVLNSNKKGVAVVTKE